VTFPNPGSEQDAIRSGHHAEWQKIVNDPRYVMQQLKRSGVGVPAFDGGLNIPMQ
jgi:hypothetical protein